MEKEQVTEQRMLATRNFEAAQSNRIKQLKHVESSRCFIASAPSKLLELRARGDSSVGRRDADMHVDEQRVLALAEHLDTGCQLLSASNGLGGLDAAWTHLRS